jgi:hypothetical protein
MDITKRRLLRRDLGIFLLGALLPTLAFCLYRGQVSLAAIDALSIVQEDDDHITIGYPHKTRFRDVVEYRVRIPKYNYPAYNSFVAIWHSHAKPRINAKEESFVTSVADY